MDGIEDYGQIIFLVVMMVIGFVQFLAKKAGEKRKNVKSRVEQERARVRQQIQERTQQAGNVARGQIQDKARGATERAKEVEKRLLEMMGGAPAQEKQGRQQRQQAPPQKQTPPPRRRTSSQAAATAPPTPPPVVQQQPVPAAERLSDAEQRALERLKRREDNPLSQVITKGDDDVYGIGKMLKDPKAAQKAMILTEIFGPPKSMQ